MLIQGTVFSLSRWRWDHLQGLLKHGIGNVSEGGSALQQKFDYDNIKCKCKPHVGLQLLLGELQKKISTCIISVKVLFRKDICLLVTLNIVLWTDYLMVDGLPMAMHQYIKGSCVWSFLFIEFVVVAEARKIRPLLDYTTLWSVCLIGPTRHFLADCFWVRLICCKQRLYAKISLPLIQC